MLARLSTALDRENWVLPRGSGERSGWRRAPGLERLRRFRLQMARGERLEYDVIRRRERIGPFK